MGKSYIVLIAAAVALMMFLSAGCDKSPEAKGDGGVAITIIADDSNSQETAQQSDQGELQADISEVDSLDDDLGIDDNSEPEVNLEGFEDW